MAIDHYKKLYTSSETSLADTNLTLRAITPKVPSVQNSLLVVELTNSEIWEAAKSLAPNKNPGEDGFPASFYQQSWEVIGGDVCDIVRWFFDHQRLCTSSNTTLISMC